MIKGVFPRLFGNFREGAILHTKFVQSAGPLYALKSAQGNANYGGITLVDGGTGLLTLAIAGGVRNFALVGAVHKSQDALVGTARKIFLYSQTESTGTMLLKLINTAATEAVAAGANGDEYHFTIYVDR